MKNYFCLILVVMTFLSSTVVQAQTRGSITGKVADKATKQPLPAANVQIIGTDFGAATDLDGTFIIDKVEENIYKLRVSYIGYQTHIETDVRVIRNKSTFVEDIELIPSAVESESVVFTTSIIDEDAQAPVSNYIYTREEIKRSPGAAGDIFRAIEALPGVSTAGGEFSAFSVRGGSPRENIILVDNIPFGKLTHFDGGNEEEEAQGGRFSIFAPGVIEQADFRGGGFSAHYGGKFSSLLDLKIREGNRETLTVDGRIDLLGWEINYDGPSCLLDNTSLFLSARSQDFNRILELTGQSDLGSPRFTDIIFKTVTELNPKNKISLLGIYAPEKFDREPIHVFESDDFAEITLADVDEEKLLLGLNWRNLTSKKSFWQNTFWYGRVDNDASVGRATPIFVNELPPQSDADFQTRENIVSESTFQEEFGTRSIFTYLPSGKTNVSLGFELSRKDYDLTRRQDGLDTLYIYDQDDFRPGPSQKYIIRRPEDVNIDFSDSRVFFASFAEFSLKPFSKLTVNLGLRHEYNQFNKDHNFSPRGSLSYRMSERTRLSLASGVYYQPPRFEIFTAAQNNLALKNERSVHLIGGITHYLRDDLKLTIEGYYKSFDDLIVRDDRTNQLRINAGNGWAAGVDITLIKRFINKFYGQINYSFAQSKRDDNNGEGSYDSDFNQPHIFSILGGYEFNKEWSVSAKWRYAAGRPKDLFIINENVFNDPDFVRFSKEITSNNADRLSDFHTFNIRVDYRKQLGRLALVSFLDVVNVYNHLNVNQDRFLELTGKEEEEGFRILPTFGLKLEL